MDYVVALTGEAAPGIPDVTSSDASLARGQAVPAQLRGLPRRRPASAVRSTERAAPPVFPATATRRPRRSGSDPGRCLRSGSAALDARPAERHRRLRPVPRASPRSGRLAAVAPRSAGRRRRGHGARPRDACSGDAMDRDPHMTPREVGRTARGGRRWIAVAAFLVSAAASARRDRRLRDRRRTAARRSAPRRGLRRPGRRVSSRWAHRLLPHGPYVEPRPVLSAGPVEREATDADIERGRTAHPPACPPRQPRHRDGRVPGRRARSPCGHSGPNPGGALRHTPWRAARRS